MTSFVDLVKHWFSDVVVQAMIFVTAGIVAVIAFVVALTAFPVAHQTPALWMAIVGLSILSLVFGRKALKKS